MKRIIIFVILCGIFISQSMVVYAKEFKEKEININSIKTEKKAPKICILDTQVKSEPFIKTSWTKTFQSKEVYVINLFKTDVVVETHTKNNIIVRVEGTEKVCKDIIAGIVDDKLVIKGRKNIEVCADYNFVNKLTWSKDYVAAENDKRKSDSKIKIFVPKGTDLDFRFIDGTIKVGDTEGDVDAIISSSLELGSIKNFDAIVQGVKDITAQYVSGDIDVKVQGPGNIIVVDGTIGKINAINQCIGDINISGSAEYANLSVKKSGSIDITFVTNRPSMNILGSGKIKVGNW